jgi:effector-binding domain-containing protein
MEREFELIEREIGNVVEIEETAPVWKMPKVMGRDFSELMNYIESQHSEYDDMPYTHYVDIDWEKELNKGAVGNILDMAFKRWHFFVGMGVKGQLDPQGNIRPSMLGKRKYVRGVHKGAYRNMGQTYMDMYDWIKQHGFTPEPECIEFYMNDPGQAKQEELETVVMVPVS